MPRILVAAAFAFVVLSLQAAEDPNGNEMPLQLYQKLKGHFDGLYGAKAGLLPGVQPVDKADIEKSLKADAAANKTVLIKALGSSQVIHRELAARALEYCGDKTAAVEALSKSLTDDKDESVRRASAAALAKMPDAAAQDALGKALFDSVETVRALSARALGNIKDSRSSERLLRVVTSDTAPMVRMQAALALKKIKDPANLDALKKVLDAEKDEGVKIAIAGAVRDLIGDSSDLAEMPSADEAGASLAKIASDMKAVEEKLRADRHDQAVQVDGSEIEKKLTKIIEQLEKSCNCQGSCNKPGEKEQQASQQKPGDPKEKKPGSGLQDSKIGGSAAAGAMNAAVVTDRMDAWAKLPPAQREELLQAIREEVPLRWRSRIEAYILSVNAEQNKDSDK